MLGDVQARVGGPGEERMHRQVARLEALYGLTQRAGTARTPEEVYEAALDALAGALGVARASILLFDPDGVMRFKAWRGISAEYRAAVEGHTPWSPTTQDPQPIVVADQREDEGLAPYRDVFEREGIRSLAFVPLVDEGRLLGKFMLYDDAPRGYTADEMQLAQTIARHVANAIHRKRAVDALADQNGRYAALLEAISDLGDAIVVAEGSRVEWANAAYADLFGYPLAQILQPGFSILSLVHEDDREDFARRLRDLATGARTRDHYEVNVVRRDGEIRRVEVSVKSFRGHPSPRRIAILRDVTARRRAEAEIEGMRQQLAHSEKMSALGSLVSGVAHEMRTPLTYLTTSLHLLQGALGRALEELPPERRDAARARVEEHVRATLEASERLDRLVDELRRYSRPRAGSFAEASLADSVRSAVDLFRATHRGEVAVEASLDRTEPSAHDGIQVQQVVLNLLQNAVEASPRGAPVRVALRALPGGGAELAVEDAGEGIPASVLERMWDPFYTTKREGTGLGLSIVRRIVEAHRGAIRCESEPGRTRFVVTFPAA